MKDLDSPSGAIAATIARSHRILATDTWNGFRRTRFDFGGREASVVEPSVAAPEGRPWTWTMQWWDAFVERTGVPDLLARGFHHVWIDLFGTRFDDGGVAEAAAFQRFLADELGFAPQARLIGMSWGGFASVRYASAHPRNVRCIYLDAPLLNFDGFAALGAASTPTEAAAKIGPWAAVPPEGGDWSADPRMPVNRAEPIARAGIPVLLLYGGQDQTVSPRLNCEPFAERFRAAGGTIAVDGRDLYGHHPHGMDDPCAKGGIVDFLLGGEMPRGPSTGNGRLRGATIGEQPMANEDKLEASRRWFKEAQYGLMVHWGLYALLGGEWRGRVMPGIAEWAQAFFRIPNAEYAALAKAFDPIFFDAEEWVRIARDAGMKYVVFTSKHHDGFAMFRSKVSRFNVVDATPFGRDVVGELAEACRKHGLKLGLYYSQDLDWSHPDGGGYTRPDDWCGSSAWTNNWDFPDKAKKDFSRYFEEKAKPQVEEILTQYGDLALVWFDIGSTLTEDQAFDLYSLVRRHQPGCLVNSRIGGCSRQGTNRRIVCDYTSSGDNEIPTDDKGAMLYESCATLNDSWGYKPTDQNWKSAEKVRATREHLKALGANYLLNVGPDPLGRIPAPAAQILREAADARNGV